MREEKRFGNDFCMLFVRFYGNYFRAQRIFVCENPQNDFVDTSNQTTTELVFLFFITNALLMVGARM